MSTTQVWLLLIVVTLAWSLINLVVSLSVRRAVVERTDDLMAVVKSAMKVNTQRTQIQELQRHTMETRLAIIEAHLATMLPAPDLESFAEDADDY